MSGGEPRRRMTRVGRGNSSIGRLRSAGRMLLCGEPSDREAEIPEKKQKMATAGRLLEALREFHGARGDTFKIPTFSKKPLDVYKLWTEVQKLGGSHQVGVDKRWASIGRLFNPPKSMTNLSFLIKQQYLRCFPAEFEEVFSGQTFDCASNATGSEGSDGERERPDADEHPEIMSPNECTQGEHGFAQLRHVDGSDTDQSEDQVEQVLEKEDEMHLSVDSSGSDNVEDAAVHPNSKVLCADKEAVLVDDGIHGYNQPKYGNNGKQDVDEITDNHDETREASDMVESQELGISSPSSIDQLELQKQTERLSTDSPEHNFCKETMFGDGDNMEQTPKPSKRRRCSGNDGGEKSGVVDEELHNWPAGIPSSSDQRAKGNYIADNGGPYEENLERSARRNTRIAASPSSVAHIKDQSIAAPVMGHKRDHTSALISNRTIHARTRAQSEPSNQDPPEHQQHAMPEPFQRQQKRNYTVKRTKSPSGYEIFMLVGGYNIDDIRIRCFDEGRLLIRGDPRDRIAAELWAIRPICQEIKLRRRVDARTARALMTLHGMLYIRVNDAQ